MAITKGDISKKLHEVASLLELAGANSFKTRAFSVAADIIEAFPGAAEELMLAMAEGKVHGIGSGIKQAIESFVTTNSLPEDLEKEISSVPRSLLQLLQISGVGPKKAKALYTTLQVTDLISFKRALESGEIAAMKGFGEKSVPKFLKALEDIAYKKRCALWAHAERFISSLTSSVASSISRIEFCGEFRRLENYLTRYDIVVTAVDSNQALDSILRFLSASGIMIQSKGVLERGVLLELIDAPPMTILFSTETRFVFDVFEQTGSEAHVGFVTAKLNGRTEFSSELELYAAAALPFTRPEHREEASAFTGPEALSKKDICGIVHSHSTFSDGKNTLREMATACRDLGYSYFCITDHSQSSAYAGGLRPDAIDRQHKEIAELNRELAPFKILRGIESDILKDGSLDYPDEILAKFDIIVTSVHGGFSMSREDQTARICAALRNKYTTILGHSTGRLLLERDGYDVDLDEVIKTAAAEKKAIEINGNPKRLDMDWKWVRKAIAAGVKIIITPDSHSIAQLDYVWYGLNVANKAGVTKEDLLNF